MTTTIPTTTARLPFSPMTDLGLLDESMKFCRMAGMSMMDAHRYAAEGDENLVPIAEDSARRYARRAQALDDAYYARRPAASA